jgi:pimeloyl-ACP methyl ester carboxylesterase
VSGSVELVRDGLRLRALTWGPEDGELVVLQHGRGGDAGTWRGVAEHLVDAGYRVLAPDLRGHGASGWDPEARYTIGVLADDLAAWIASATSSSCVLVGHSYGAATSLATAALHPGLVRSLVLEDGGPAGRLLLERWGRTRRQIPGREFPSADDAVAAMELLWPGDTTPDNRDRRLAQFFTTAADGTLTWRSDQPGMAAAPRDRLLLEESWSLLDRLRCPLTLVVAGQRSMLDPDVAERVRARVPGARVTVVAGAGHDVHTDRPAEFLRVLDGVLAAASPEVTR